LVGFPACKRFVILENEALSPFRILRSVDHDNVGFLVLDPRTVVKNYTRSFPEEGWKTVGFTNPANRLSMVISIIGSNPEDSTANLQAPLLINYKQMKGRQMILTGTRYSVTHPLLSQRANTTKAKAHSASNSVH